jgi:membrane associated rhomboid family serine protease
MVLPIYDDNPFKLPHRPVMTWSLIGVNFLVFLLELTSGNPQQMLNNFGIVPASITGEVDIKGVLSPVLTLVTYMFLHADWGHIFGNMLFLWVFGDNVEESLGRARFLVFYLLCGIIGGIVFVFSDLQSQNPLIGASGAVAGVIIAYVMLRPCAKITVLFGIIPLRISAYWVVGSFVVLQIINLESSSKSEVAYWCHFGGMIAGGVLFALMRPPGVKLFECIRGGPVPDTRVATIPGPWGTPR